MSKELEALNYVWYHYYTEELDQDEVDEIEKNLNVVQDGLKRLDSIDNANPSEALECLDNLFSNVVSTTYTREHSQDYNAIKQALLKAQKEHKALEIIKEKRIDIESFYTSFIEGKYDYNFYEIRYGTYGKYCLTEEEFNLLKEVLE